jgi:hypothetical protein
MYELDVDGTYVPKHVVAVKFILLNVFEPER